MKGPGAQVVPRIQRVLPGRAVAFFLAVAFGIGGGGMASGQEDAPARKKPEVVISDAVSIDVTGRPLPEVLKDIASRTGRTLVYDEKPLSSIFVTIVLREVFWQKALELIADKYGLILEIQGENIVKIVKPPTVSVDLQNAPIKTVIRMIAKWATKNIVVSDRITGTITLTIKDVPWKEALEAIVKTNQFHLVRESSRIYRVVTKEEIQLTPENKVLQLKYIRPKSAFIPAIKGDVIKGDVTPGAPAQFTLLDALRGLLTRNLGSLTYFPDTNTIFVRDIKPVIDKIENIILQLDVEPKQVFVDVKFIRTNNTDFFDFGFDIGSNGINLSQSFGSLVTRFPFQVGKGGFEDRIVARDTRSTGFPENADLSAVVAAANLFTLGTMDFSRTSITLRLLKRDVRSKVVQAPKIVTLDHQEATIFVGDTIRFHETSVVTSDQGTSTTQLTEAKNSPINVGFQLLIVPHIIPGTKKIIMTIIPKNRTIKETKTITAGTSTLQLIDTSQQEMVTHMLLESGQTMVIGGLLQKERTRTMNKVPFLGDIPLLAPLFRSTVDDIKTSDLIIFVTPRIVPSTAQARAQIDEQIEAQRRRALIELFKVSPKTLERKKK